MFHRQDPNRRDPAAYVSEGSGSYLVPLVFGAAFLILALLLFWAPNNVGERPANPITVERTAPR
jgi:hypothetical protein